MWTLPRSLLKKFYQVSLNMRMQIAAGSDRRLHTHCVQIAWREKNKKITVLEQRKTKDKKVTLARSIKIFYPWFFYCLRTVIFSVSSGMIV